MKNFNRWDNLTFTELKLLSSEKAIVLLPIGSIEQHGPHLPVGTDTILATAMAEKSAEVLNQKGIKAIVAPSLTVCNSTHHMSFSGSMTLTPTTFMQVLLENCKCIAAHGFQKIVLINGHGGNQSPIQCALITINETLGFPVYHMNYYKYPNMSEEHPRFLTTQSGMIHACEAETSLMLAINESLVDPIYKETSGKSVCGFWAEDDGMISTFRRMEHVTDNGVEGNSYAATKEKGEAIIALSVTNLVNVLSSPQLWANS